ncbi:MAG: zinc ribbon domain-containing protein [Acidobacteriia bacterium]|nr:zinc ribbon domain-containing protein [Terriglobia bacterium]
MEHPCYKCGAGVEDGTPFCPQCNAPQIRVAGVSLAQSSELPEVIPGRLAGTSASAAIQWSQALPSAALAGLFAAFLMFIPLGAFGLGMIAAGVLAVLFYQRHNPANILTPGMGARLGAVSGVLGFGIFAVFIAVAILVFHGGGELRAAMLQTIEQSATRTSDPQAQRLFDYLKSPDGLVVMVLFWLVVVFVLFLILSSLGGALGAALLRRKGRP